MPNIDLNHLDSGVARLTLNIGRGNPLTPEAVQELEATLNELKNHPPKALLIDSADPKIFSGGFSLPIIGSWQRSELADFFAGFLRCVQTLLRFPCPTVCAVDGHAVAGGFILSLAADLRVVGKGPIKLGLSETKLAVAVPAGTLELLAARTSVQHALRLGMLAHLMGPDEALRIGYADQLADDVSDASLSLAVSLAKLPGTGATVTRQFRGNALAERVQQADNEHLSAFLDSWFSPTAQRAIQAMAQKLSG